MVDLPLDVLLLIAEYFMPSEQLSLAAFHRHFLHDFLNRRYYNPVVLTDFLQRDLQRGLDADLSRIRGPIACKLVKRLKLRTHQLPGKRQSPLVSRLQRLISWSSTPFSSTPLGTTILHTLEGLPNLRYLHLSEIPLRSEETPTAFGSTTWMRLLPDVWQLLAPRLEELHVQGHLPLLQAAANLDPQSCPKLSTLCMTSYRAWGGSRDHDYLVPSATAPIVRFINALSLQLSHLGLLGESQSAMPRILEGVQHIRFSRLRTFHVDLIHDRFRDEVVDTFSSCANLLVSHDSSLRSLSIRPQVAFMQRNILSDFLENDCGVIASLRRLDLDLGESNGQYGIGQGSPGETLCRVLDSIQQLRGLKHLVLRQPVVWSVNPRISIGTVMSGFSPHSTLRKTPRTFKFLRTVSFSLHYLRAQIFEDLAEAIPRLEQVDLEFQEVWHSVEEHGSDSVMEIRIGFATSAASLADDAVNVFVEELSILPHIRDMQLRLLQLRWLTNKKTKPALKEMILGAVRKEIPALSLGSMIGHAQFVEPRKRWEQDLQWMDIEGVATTDTTQ